MHRGEGDFTTDAGRIALLSAIAPLLGALSGLIAFLLLRLISLITNLAYFGRWSTALVAPTLGHFGVWTVAIPVLGGLAVGLLARYGTEQIRGHGIPEAIQVILEDGSRMRPRVAIVKPIASAITIGTGGLFGAEGPIIMTGGAIGSLVAQWFPLSSLERRTLLVAGAAGGMAATFGAPVSSVLLAMELFPFVSRPGERHGRTKRNDRPSGVWSVAVTHRTLSPWRLPEKRPPGARGDVGPTQSV